MYGTGGSGIADPGTFTVLCTGRQDTGSAVLRLSGELDIVGVPVLERELTLALDGRPARVILDLSNLSFLDASGIGVIAGGIDRARRQGTTVSARGPRGIVRRVLQLTGFDSVLGIGDEPAPAAGKTDGPYALGASREAVLPDIGGSATVYATPTADDDLGPRRSATARRGGDRAERPSGFASGDHVCWVYRGEAAFTAAAVEYLAEGLEREEQLLYVADRPAAVLINDLNTLGDVGELIDRGVLSVRSIDDMYVADRQFDAALQVAGYRQRTGAALASGYRGLRVAVDATALVTDARERAQFLRYELAVDDFMTRAPMTAMCAYSHRTLGDATAELACVHPRRYAPGGPSFCLFAGETGLTMAGEIDLTEHTRLRAALQAALAVTPDDDITIDLSPLEFIDAAGLAELSSLAASLGADHCVNLVGASGTARRCWQILELERPGRVELR
jgi:anti-anti-sigma factor